MIFKHNFEIGLENIKSNKELTNKAILQYLENIASKHSDSIQNGVGEIIETGITWVLLEWKLKVIERPKYGDIIEAHTWIRNSTKLYSYRDFEIYVNGKLKAIASSKWLLVDKKTLKPLRITDELLNKYQPELDKNVFGTLEFEKIEEQEEYEKEIEYPIRKSDIDINNHVHNLNYIDMAYEILNIENQFNEVNILYKKEIKYGDKIKISLHEKNGEYYCKIYDLENKSIKALIEMK